MTTELNERKCLLFVIIKRRTRAIIRTERNLTAHLGILARLTRRWVVKTVERVPATMAYSDAEWAHINDEFKRTKDTAYLDHAGATLYSESQLAAVYALLGSTLIGNPHTTKRTEDLIDQARFRILRTFNVNADEYSVVFTSGATAALKLVAECFAFDDDDGEAIGPTGGCFAYLRDNHTSVLGMRAIVKTKNVVGVEFADFMAAQPEKAETNAMVGNGENTKHSASNSLFVLPGQCNFSGFKYPLSRIEAIQRHGPQWKTSKNTPNNNSTWYVLLDAASLAATSYLDLRQHPADFVCLSFYKLFGYPTGLGALLVSRRGEGVLHKRYYGGGTVQIAMASHDWHVPRRPLHERFEDGTVAFLSVAALLAGYDTLDRLVPPTATKRTMQRIGTHCFRMARDLYEQLKGLEYSDGGKVVRFYCDTEFGDESTQGGIVNFNVLDEKGGVVGFREVGEIAEVFGVSLRTGCFCNPGACQRHLRLSDADVREHFLAGHVCGDQLDLIDGTPTGSVRLSVGYMTRPSDIDRVVRMIADTYIGSHIHRNLRNLHPNDLSHNTKPPAQSAVRLHQIHVYPIKSCAPHRITAFGQRWPLNERGLCYDRDWMIVNRRTGVAMTQKTNTRMCMVRPHLDTAAGRMVLTFAPHHDDDDEEVNNDSSVSVPLQMAAYHHIDAADDVSASLCQSKVCGDRIEGIDCGDRVAAWLAHVLCEPDARLIRQHNRDVRRFRRRPLNGNSEPLEAAQPGPAISLVNQAQFLLINLASVDWLNERVDAWSADAHCGHSLRQRQRLRQQTVDRFRANLVVDGRHVLHELQWQRLSVERGLGLRVQGPCTRCQMICIDQSSGEKTVEPLRTIAKLFGGRMRFGVYLEYAEQGDGLMESTEYLECGEWLSVGSEEM